MGRFLTPATTAAANDDGDLKTSWPEVVGWVTLNASFKITADRPDVSTAFYSDTTPLPTDYNPKRVIIIFDSGNVVVRTPVVG
ncbi:hypothetical protein BDA96_04G025300 [Sorghum bicolor]|jgi:hypothetical protein|uniref:Uncharacterized protein n=2 Tax=Sorghum bicolor TaxID=4558 RepID=A0A921R118_SORBI|nr:hypothetical protein BDA96_04G025300 [Sorghum bicolor]OQU84258.1 hypothetical protein SORBI_3004G022600 [Sorghum bicolor]